VKKTGTTGVTILHHITLETIYSGVSKVTLRTSMATQLKNNVWV